MNTRRKVFLGLLALPVVATTGGLTISEAEASPFRLMAKTAGGKPAAAKAAIGKAAGPKAIAGKAAGPKAIAGKSAAAKAKAGARGKAFAAKAKSSKRP